jgi:hypothetical protein
VLTLSDIKSITSQGFYSITHYPGYIQQKYNGRQNQRVGQQSVKLAFFRIR